MKLNHFKLRSLLALVLSAMLGLTACDKDDNKNNVPTSGDNLEVKLKADAELSLFRAAIEKGELNTFITGPGPFTLLAPTNAAFNAIGINSEADLNTYSKAMIDSIITFHIIPGRRLNVEIPTGPNSPITTQLTGQSVYAARFPAGVFFNGAKITTTDIVASNGVIHKIDRVLLPARVNVLALLTANPNHKLFVQAITKAATTATFTGTPALVTVFAPTNAAMTAGGYDSTTIANTAAATLLPIIRYHVIPTRMFSNEFRNDSLKSVQGPKFRMLSGSPAQVRGNTNAPGFFNIGPGTDYVGTNGIIHVINGLMKP
jgi:uncharacterized surface protein with fasciclin (FAS1) repeats